VEYISDLGNMGWLAAVKVPTWGLFGENQAISLGNVR